MVLSILGNRHQGSAMFHPFNGMQCAGIAVVALVFCYLHPTRFDLDYQGNFSIESSDIDHILLEGTALYGDVIRNIGEMRYLSHTDLPRQSSIFSQDIHLQYIRDFSYGVVGDSGHPEIGDQDFASIFHQAVLLSPFQLLTFGSQTVAIYYSHHSDSVVVFDSHARNCYGFCAADGVAGFFVFSDMEEFMTYICTLYQNQRFDITPVFVDSERTVMQNPQLPVSQQNVDTSMLDVQYVCTVSTEQDNTSTDNFTQQSNMHTKTKTTKKTKLEDHSYAAFPNKKIKKAQKAVKKNCNFNVEETSPIFSETSDSYNDLDMLGVQYLCNVTTEETNYPWFSTNYCGMPEHEKSYETFIQKRPSFTCSCCNRFLFVDQTVHLTNMTKSLNIQHGSVLCTTCKGKLQANKMPNIAYFGNSLNVAETPIEMQNISWFEKKMLSKIHIFMNIVILPGGQFGEKGLILNLPFDVHEIISQIPDTFDTNTEITVQTVNGEVVVQSTRQISCFKLLKAFLWLKNNNPLYKTLEISDVTKKIISLQESACKQTSIQSNQCSFDSEFEHFTFTPIDGTLPDKSILNVITHKEVTLNTNLNKPINIYSMESGEEMTFPWLFPNGINGYCTPRVLQIPMGMYFKTRLYDMSGAFRKNITYLLHSAVSYDVSLLLRTIHVNMKIKSGSLSHREDQRNITAADVMSLQPDSPLLENSYMFMKRITGTVAYFRNALYNLLAMFRTLGPPTLFMTLSANDLHWIECGMTLENIDFEEAAKRRSFIYSVKNDPLLTAIHFDRRFKALLKYVILSGPKPLGEVTDYFSRVEFQNRGSPHIHMFLWVKGVPDITDKNSLSRLKIYLNNTVSAIIPDSECDMELHQLVKAVQIHSHTAYCSKGFRSACRFGFPKPVHQESCIISHIEPSKQRKGQFYFLKRSSDDSYVNPYNPTILRHWRANMDIQLICNPEGAAYYVCAYLCKSEPQDLKNALGDLINNIFKKNPAMPKHQRLRRIGMCVLKHRQMSGQEAGYRLGNFCLVQCTRKVVYLNTRPKAKRYKMLKSKKDLETLPSNSTDIFKTNIIDYYYKRPNDMANISLYRFAAYYYVTSNNAVGKNSKDRIFIKDYNVYLKKRKEAAIIRFPTFSPTSEHYYFALLMLLLPHRTEEELLHPYNTFREAFYKKCSNFDTVVDFVHFSFVEEVQTAIRRINLCENILSVPFSSNRDHDDENTNNEICNIINSLDNTDNTAAYSHCSGDLTLEDEGDTFSLHSLQCSVGPLKVAELMNNMTNSQRKVFEFISNQFHQSPKERFHIFITGGAGTGKSYLTRLLVGYIQLYHSPVIGTSPVLVCAPTGTAAANIQGVTLHSALRIPIDSYLHYSSLEGRALSILRRQYTNIHTVIIDEISMVSSLMLIFISNRLSEIKDSSLPFGGLNIITVGDFFPLKPVSGSFAFHNTLLWSLFQPFFLIENMRQTSNVTYANLLNRARIGMLTIEDEELLKSRLIPYPAQTNGNILHIYPTVEQVNQFNCRFLDSSNSQIFTAHAEHFFASDDIGVHGVVSDSLILDDRRQAGGLENILSFTINSRVMLLRNIYTKEGLVNGAMGTVSDVQEDEYNCVKIIYVIFDNDLIGKTLQIPGMQNAIPIHPVEADYLFAGRHIIRQQFPLCLCWASTIHKVQGISLNDIAVDIGKRVFQNAMSYVALSRVRTLNGLYLLSLDFMKIQPNKDVLDEYCRLLNVDNKNDNEDL